MIIVRWKDGAETFETARRSEDAIYGGEQGQRNSSYQGTRYELFAERIIHGKKTHINLDGLYVYAESMDTFEEFKAERERQEKLREQQDLWASHQTIIFKL